MNETILNGTLGNGTISNVDLGSIKTTSVGILEYLRQGMSWLGTWLSNHSVPFGAQNITIALFVILSLFISAKIVNPKTRTIWWFIIATIIFYFLYMFK
jgi:hypothetical protein